MNDLAEKTIKRFQEIMADYTNDIAKNEEELKRIHAHINGVKATIAEIQAIINKLTI